MRNILVLPVRKMSQNNSSISNLPPLKQPQGLQDNSTRITSMYSTSAIKASLIILAMEIALGFFANTALFVKLRNYRRNRTVYRVLLQNLCLIGTLSSLIGMPSLFSATFLSFIEWTSVPAALCRTRYFSLTYFYITDSINICLLSLERYDFISRPFQRRITKENVKGYLAIIWVVPFLVGLLHLVIKIDSTNCILISSAEGPYSEPMTVLLTVILVLTCSFVVIINRSSLKSMRKLSRRLNNSRQNCARSERTMTFLTMKIVTTYLVSVVPTPLWSFSLSVGGIRNCLFCNDMRIYLQLLLFVRYIANPFIFMGSMWKKKKRKRKIGVLEDRRSRSQNRKQAAIANVQPFLVVPTHNPGDMTSYGSVHKLSRRQRVAPWPSLEEKKRGVNIDTAGGVEYANQGTQTADFEALSYLKTRKQTNTISNLVPTIVLDTFVVK